MPGTPVAVTGIGVHAPGVCAMAGGALPTALLPGVPATEYPPPAVDAPAGRMEGCGAPPGAGMVDPSPSTDPGGAGPGPDDPPPPIGGACGACGACGGGAENGGELTAACCCCCAAGAVTGCCGAAGATPGAIW